MDLCKASIRAIWVGNGQIYQAKLSAGKGMTLLLHFTYVRHFRLDAGEFRYPEGKKGVPIVIVRPENDQISNQFLQVRSPPVLVEVAGAVRCCKTGNYFL